MLQEPPDPNVKSCRKCGETKSLGDFYRQAGMRDGHRNDCKDCQRAAHRDWYSRNREYSIGRVKEWQHKNPERLRAWRRKYREEHGEEKKRRDREGHLRRKYGVTQNMFEALVLAQLGKCAICGANEAMELHIDHDHRTKKVRGLVCGKCNKAIGLLNDDPDRLTSAKKYLERADRFWSRSA